MRPLLGKLGQLLSDEYNLSTKVKKGVSSLTTELTMMEAALLKVAEVPRDQLDNQVRIWAGRVRELSYEMEDTVDAFMIRLAESADGELPTMKNRVKKIMKKTTRLFRKGKDLHQISDAIEEAQDLAKQLGELRQRYGLEMHDLSAAAASVIDPRLMAMYKDVTELVGVDGTRDELVEMLIGCEDWKKQQLKVVSVVGFGGLGKTTLAKAVYEKIKVQFDCGAFVSVSQSPDLKRVFKDMIYELDKNKYGEIHRTARGEKQLLDELIEILKNKRYLIVIDDIWDEKVWGLINCAFSLNSLGSRLITTTRKVNVSEACTSSSTEDKIYKMKPLSDDDSQRLFYRRIFQGKTGCPHELEQVSRGILKKCGGVPLAIITIASLLASNQKIKTKDQWYVLLNSIGRGLVEGDSLEEMQRILSFSYYDLPPHLKICLLYLSIFPEDYEISRDRLIWMWIAEGFVQPNKQGTKMFELGEGYFNELVNRNMIQPVDINVEGRASACRVHDMVLDLICSLSTEENFVTILDGIQRSTPNSQSKIRRLSLQNGMEDTFVSQLATTSMTHLRSVTLFEPATNVMPSLSRFGVIRVLDLGDCKMSESWYKINLKYIGNLLHLRYLGLVQLSIKELPVEIGKLKYLQMLDLSGCFIDELPSSVILLKHLLVMRIGYDTKMPIGLGKLVSLQELAYLLVNSNNQNNAKELGHLTELRVLEILWGELDGSLEKVMVESLSNLRKLHTLRIGDYSSEDRMIMLDGWVPAPKLRRFTSEVMFSTLPKWINSSLLPLLSTLHIRVDELQLKDIQLIGRLPALLDLWLGAEGGVRIKVAPEESLVVTADSFPCMKCCTFYSLQILPSMFPPGAMPMVQFIRFTVNAWNMGDAELDLDMENLPLLERVEVDLRHKGPSAAVEEAEAALRLAADVHPNRPTLLIHKFYFY
ncbi:hypothetical protein QYE76_045510 [Lolium multiflorum]|uniref:Uncharacterized protein n=1 Tax=Lolium multiflorum TaxID=4521 RepID=A0AAD8WXJ4_LOLMU|nr:hypothetical protein QYE76_045510 [Lolium multiflorum]